MEKFSPKNNYSFKRYYVCFPNPDLNDGNQIILPESTLSSLIERKVHFPYFFRINKYHRSDHDSDVEYIIPSPNTVNYRSNRLTYLDYESDYADKDSSYEKYDDFSEEENKEDVIEEENKDDVSSEEENKDDIVSEEDDKEIETKEIEENESLSSHCGVMKFTSEEGIAYLPQWMMLNLSIEKGDEIVLRNVNLVNGIYVKMNPLNENFLKLYNPKVILEKKLRQFACLTPGDIIPIVYNDVKYDIQVVETNPSIGISVMETDCEVEFTLPEPELKPEIADSRLTAAVTEKKTEDFGRARWLDGGEKDYEVEHVSGSRCMARLAAVVKQLEVEEKENKFVALRGKKYKLS